MTTLLRAEIRRAVSRRLIRLTALVATVALVALGVLLFVVAESTPPAEKTRARLVDNCQFEPDPGRCEAELPTVEQLRTSESLLIDSDDRPHLVELWPDDDARDAGLAEGGGILTASSIVFLMVAVILGASLVGADFSSRMIEGLLTWEPRRVHLALSRFVAVTVVVGLLYLALQAVLVLVLLPGVVFKGTAEGADTEWLVNLVVMVGRTALLVAGFAVVGAAVALIVRHTSGAIAAFFAYLVGVEMVLRGLKPEWTDWYVLSNVAALLDPVEAIEDFTRTTLGAGFLLLLYLLVVVVAATALFRARDLG